VVYRDRVYTGYNNYYRGFCSAEIKLFLSLAKAQRIEKIVLPQMDTDLHRCFYHPLRWRQVGTEVQVIFSLAKALRREEDAVVLQQMDTDFHR